jgi:hypothetical protein
MGRAMTIYGPPAGIDDFSRRPKDADKLAKGWNDWISSSIQSVRTAETASGLFYDQLADTSGVQDSEPQGITWSAFPLFLTRWFSTEDPDTADRLAGEAAETLVNKPSFGLFTKNPDGTYKSLPLSYRRQDEYCEWFVEKDGSKIQRIYFTVEPPEYWEFMAGQDLTLVHELYKELLHNNNIPISDLRWDRDIYSKDDPNVEKYTLQYSAGSYNGHNKWNTEQGAVHLTHWANALSAEIQLASDGTLGWPIKPNAAGVTDRERLISCAGFGGINRSSDPRIGGSVFDYANKGLSVALANPIGLYMQPFDLKGLLNPARADVGAECMHVVRQSVDGRRVLRVEVSPPAGANYTLDECTLDGKKLTTGSQIARRITMVLYGVAKKIPGVLSTDLACKTFACAYPPNPQFKTLFRVKPGDTCEKMKTSDFLKSGSFRDVPLIASTLLSLNVDRVVTEQPFLKRPGRSPVW